MPFASHVFRHTPALRGRITPPEQSDMRFGQDRFVELEEQAKAEGWPSDWRMDETAREENRTSVLAGRLDQDLWVFAYGSLIWDPAVQVEEYRYGTLSGWCRSFCMRLEGGRGSPKQPGLMAALDEGGTCEGVVFRIPAALVDRETQFMWRREMFSGAYRPVFLPIQTPQDTVQALCFVMERSNRRYVPDISQEETARIIAVAEGGLGSNFDYLDSMTRHLQDLGLQDPDIFALHAQANAHHQKNT